MMNHPTFGLPTFAIGNPAVGTITTTINPEQNQFALKLYSQAALPHCRI